MMLKLVYSNDECTGAIPNVLPPMVVHGEPDLTPEEEEIAEDDTKA